MHSANTAVPRRGPQVDVAHETRTRLRVRVAPANSSRWEVPRELVARCGLIAV